jgi:hypothetical protein
LESARHANSSSSTSSVPTGPSGGSGSTSAIAPMAVPTLDSECSSRLCYLANVEFPEPHPVTLLRPA